MPYLYFYLRFWEKLTQAVVGLCHICETEGKLKQTWLGNVNCLLLLLYFYLRFWEKLTQAVVGVCHICETEGKLKQTWLGNVNCLLLSS